MKRRMRTTLFGVGAILALVSAFGVNAGTAQAAEGAEALAVRTAATTAGRPKPVLVPRSTPYRRTGCAAPFGLHQRRITFSDGVSASIYAGREKIRSAYFISGAAVFDSSTP